MTTRRSFLLTAAALPAIAQLKSRRSEAKPITAAEREGRVERARELMTANKLDAICLSGGTSLRYFTGIRWGTSERLFACVLPRRGEPFYVCPAFEEERAREQAGDKVRVLTWQEDEDPYALVGKGLGASAIRIGMEERTIYAYADGIAHANRGATVVSATPVTAGCRARKSPAELELLRLANNITL